MADFNFPASPIPNQEHIENGNTYIWNGFGWAIKTVPATGGEGGSSTPTEMSYSGMQTNGSFDVDQEHGGVAIATGFPGDCWQVRQNGTFVLSTATTKTNVGGWLPGNFLHASVTTAQATLGADNYTSIAHDIEGYDVAHLFWGTPKASPVTMAFWSAHGRVGLHTGTVRNSAHTRTFAFSYAQTTANVAQYNTITIPGCLDGVWEYGPLAGLKITFSLGCGATATAPSNESWLAGNYIAGAGQVNAVADITDIFRISRFLILPGLVAPTAVQSPLIVRPYPQELVKCKRHWRKLARVNIAGNGSVGSGETTYVLLDPPMRIAPAITFANNAEANCPPMQATEVYSDSVCFQTTPTVAGGFFAIADAYLNARL